MNATSPTSRITSLGATFVIGIACSAHTMAQAQFLETEPNAQKFEATPVLGLAANDAIVGTSTGSSTAAGLTTDASADMFRIKTSALSLGVYRHRLTLTTSGIAGHSASIRGRSQAAGVPVTADVAVQTAITTSTPPRFVQWYGFGKQEEIFYRVTGNVATTASYVATLSTAAVVPTPVASAFDSGLITISTVNQTALDTMLQLFDANLDAIPGASNDSSYGVSTLTRTLAPGTYFLAIGSTNQAWNFAAPPDDGIQNGNLMDFPGSLVCSSGATTSTDWDFSISDVAHTVAVVDQVAAPHPFETSWWRFTVGSPPAVARTTRRISVDSNGFEGNNWSQRPVISADGRWVLFESYASNFASGTSGLDPILFLHDLRSGLTTLASIDLSGTTAVVTHPSNAISADGRIIAYGSTDANVVAGDTNSLLDVFVRDLQTATTVRASVSSSGTEGNGHSAYPRISDDGRRVCFWSEATNLVAGDTNGVADVFVRDLSTNTTMRASVDSNGAQGAQDSPGGSISGDGRFVAVMTKCAFVASDTNSQYDVYLRDLQSGTTTPVSVDPQGVPGNSASFAPVISGDGRYVVFASVASNLVPGDTNATDDVFVRDTLAGTTTRVSVSSSGALGNAASTYAAISSDGKTVAFQSKAVNLVPGDSNGIQDVFVHDMTSGETTRASVSTSGIQATSECWSPSLSSDGRRLVYATASPVLVGADNNFSWDVFLRDAGANSVIETFCSGDGTDATCPCTNAGAAGRGCDNSVASGGARLTGTGLASVAMDTLVLAGTGVPASVTCVFFQGSTTSATMTPFGAVFGNGLLCVAGSMRRLEVRFADAAGRLTTTTPVHDPGSTAASDLRCYQLWYRDTGNVGTCTPGAGFNLSNALSLTWAP